MRRALLIGSQTFGLRGVNHDLRLMAQTLEKLGFSLTSLSGTQATRKGVLDTWELWSASVDATDELIVYYAGHGGRARNPQWRTGSAEPRHLRFLVPTDMGESSSGDFRGILDLELSHLVARLAGKCNQVAVLLDCCHAARLVRETRRRARSLRDIWELGVATHLERLQREAVIGHAMGQSRVVRLTAAGPNQSAYEDPDENRGGYFTEALAEALAMTGKAPVCWDVLGRWVREQVLIMEPRQRPELEGPVEKSVFGTDSSIRAKGSECAAEAAARLSFFFDGPDGDVASLRGGRLHGVAVGNRYAVLDLAGAGEAPARRVATAEVTEVFGTISRVALTGDTPRDGAPVRPLRELFPSRPVAMAPDVPAALLREIERSRLLQVAPPACRNPLARVENTPTGLLVRDEAMLAAAFPTHSNAETVAILECMARALTIRELSDPPEAALNKDFDLEWGVVLADGRIQPISAFESLLRPGDRIYVRVTNRDTAPLFVNLFDVGISRRISLMNRDARSGFELGNGETWCFGYRAGFGLLGIPLTWPDSVPRDEIRLETLVVFLSDRAVDLSVLENKGVGQRGDRKVSSLERNLAARFLGTHRSGGANASEDTRYTIRHIDIDLVPEPR